jgi:hypothetical protein
MSACFACELRGREQELEARPCPSRPIPQADATDRVRKNRGPLRGKHGGPRPHSSALSAAVERKSTHDAPFPKRAKNIDLLPSPLSFTALIQTLAVSGVERIDFSSRVGSFAGRRRPGPTRSSLAGGLVFSQKAFEECNHTRGTATCDRVVQQLLSHKSSKGMAAQQILVPSRVFVYFAKRRHGLLYLTIETRTGQKKPPYGNDTVFPTRIGKHWARTTHSSTSPSTRVGARRPHGLILLPRLSGDHISP